MYSIILDKVTVNKEIVYYNFSYSRELGSYFSRNQLFFDFGEDMSDTPISILAIPFVATFLGIAWMENTNLFVPELDKTYYESLFRVRIAYQEMYHKAHLKGRVVPSRIIQNEMSKSSEMMLLFGGGVDAHTSCLRHKDEITEIVNIQGWYKSLDSLDKAADADEKICAEYARFMGLKFDYVRCNFASVINPTGFNKKFQKILGDTWWHGIQHAMAFLSIAMVLAFKHGISRIMIGSSLTVGTSRPCASYITTDSAFHFAGVGEVIHDAFELSRQQKVKTIVDYQRASRQPYPLKVCSFNDRNCCACEKCFRTMIEIIAEGGNVADFGFTIKEPLHAYMKKMLNERIALWGLKFEYNNFWIDTLARMRENYSQIQEKEFVDWLLSCDFNKMKKVSLRNYYANNFFSILKRKIRNLR